MLVIITRTKLWWAALIIVAAAVLIADRRIFLSVDYVLIITFLCFFIFSSSIAGNESIAGFLSEHAANREYWWAIGLSQIISNVPASIVLYPFTKNFAGLIYGADTAGLCSLIGSLASVINYRIYVREYPGGGKKIHKDIHSCFVGFFCRGCYSRPPAFKVELLLIYFRKRVKNERNKNFEKIYRRQKVL